MHERSAALVFRRSQLTTCFELCDSILWLEVLLTSFVLLCLVLAGPAWLWQVQTTASLQPAHACQQATAS
jgi:hypothetical protein